jgi:ribosomal protein S18 acetylase RimI-like enzyme
MTDTVRYVEKIVRDWHRQHVNFRETELRGLLRLCRRCGQEEFRLQTSLHFTGTVPSDTKKYTEARQKKIELGFHILDPSKRVGIVVAIKGQNVAGFTLFVVNDKSGSATMFCLLVDDKERGRGIGAELVRRTQAYVAPYALLAQYSKLNDFANVDLWKSWMQKLGFNRLAICRELDLYRRTAVNAEHVVVMSASYEDLRWRYMMTQENELLRGGRRPTDEESREFMTAARGYFEAVFARHFPGEARA